MNCKNHPESSAKGTCASCGDCFCEECLSLFNEEEFCPACLKAEVVLATSRMGGSARELVRMKRTLTGCAVILLALAVIPMVILIYPVFRLGDVGRCRDNLKRIHAALVRYSEENEGRFPPENNDLGPLFEGEFLKDVKVFRCPGTKRFLGKGGSSLSLSYSSREFPSGSSYLYQGGLLLPEADEASTALLWDRSPRNHRGKGINVLGTDGAVKFETKELSRIRLRRMLPER
jgi:hypothetical protein